MIRTHVYLTEEQAQTIKRRAQQEQKPKAEVIRELLDSGLVAHSTTGRRKSTGETLLELATLGEKLGLKGPADLSTNLDDYLYGDKE